ncbi:MAG: hypothetical protein GWN99_05375 [Gemmatimonadetes bacterium]|uniref:Uncharacterized protein n=1 Tax=Candidatus Kutchimonas denitrificans TaxID=3056748 RepID=A0AAE4ZBE0_9BACT|nr:hypothetical protein [Gemmatimonadota bacterium]NIR76117.1 hypothetical protein [Candidatus Kutchimonas denitrificans]NIS00496.1 hypothetical protein [Gemmatimonadota bacterium]NIT66154.1 hypothetical protein [Gemmatimonadota bacterium]NIU54232.1 hypothetical protein [Gemmatimonadota bacterium]
MTVTHWLGVSTFILLALLIAAGMVQVARRRRRKVPPETGWLTDDMVREIIEEGELSGRYVPEEALDLEEIAREEERFWSETWDETEPYWE